MSDDAFEDIVRNFEQDSTAGGPPAPTNGSVSLLLVPSRSLEAVAGACRTLGVDGHASIGDGGVLISGTERAKVRHAAAELSSALGGRLPVLLLARDGRVADEGHLKAEQWQAGSLTDTPNIALLFDRLPAAAQDVLLKDLDLGETPGAVAISEIPESPVGAVFASAAVDTNKLLRRMDLGMSAALCAAAVLVFIGGLGYSPKNWVTIILAALVAAWTGWRIQRLLAADSRERARNRTGQSPG